MNPLRYAWLYISCRLSGKHHAECARHQVQSTQEAKVPMSAAHVQRNIQADSDRIDIGALAARQARIMAQLRGLGIHPEQVEAREVEIKARLRAEASSLGH